MKSWSWILVIMIILFASITFFLYHSLVQSNTQLSIKEGQFKQAESDIQQSQNDLTILQNKVDSLEKEKNTLSIALEKTEIEKENITEQYVRLRWDVASTINDLEDFKKDVNKSMDWFNANSYLDESNTLGWAKKNIQNHCYRVIGDECRIKTACFYLVNQEFLNIHYQRDIQVTGEIDKLLSLKDFYDNRGGDCEDYSLFYKAEHNNILERCNKRGVSNDNIIIETWIPDPIRDNKYYVNFNEDKQWYINDVDVYEITGGYVYPNIVCGDLMDPIISAIAGHCVIAFTKAKITTINDIYPQLNNAPMIEPQDGRYMGRINGASSSIFINSNTDDTRHTSSIWQVITDEDLFRYYRERDTNWLGYSSFSDLLSERILTLRNLK